ncbi:MAG: hypothetical protein DMG57_44325 [Acidobacteria bacterium]|nr:MAG: hypothetical protein DMG57_44325 [Acidobacteriota bacterium]
MHAELLRLIRLMQESRMGFYIHCGRKGKLTVLEDIVTGAVFCFGPAIAERKANSGTSACSHLPLLAARNTSFSRRLISYCSLSCRSGASTSAARSLTRRRWDDYERHMKYGPTRPYWNDFVFEAYVNHRAEAIYLAGLPDVPETRPHSEVSQVNGWKSPDFIIQP